MDMVFSDELADRLERLEQECRELKQVNRRMRRVGGLIVVATVLITLGGAQLSQRIEEIRAGTILLVDKAGFPRALLGVTPDLHGGAVFQISHQGANHPQIVLTVNKSNQVALTLLDTERRPRIFLGLEPDGSPRLRLQDKDGTSLFQAPIEANPTVPTLLRP